MREMPLELRMREQRERLERLSGNLVLITYMAQPEDWSVPPYSVWSYRVGEHWYGETLDAAVCAAAEEIRAYNAKHAPEPVTQ